MNPRIATNDLLPFQGSPFNHLGTSAIWLNYIPFGISYSILHREPIILSSVSHAGNGESGIRTHAPFRTNGFQDRLVMTTSISLQAFSQTCFIILFDKSPFVNHFFQVFLKFFNFVSVERRRRDLNPRAATNDLLPFQGSPFNHLGTSASG